MCAISVRCWCAGDHSCENQSFFSSACHVRYGTSLTFMEEKMLSCLGLCSDALVSLSSVGIPRLVVADGRPMPVFRL